MSQFPTIKIAELVGSGEATLQTGPFGTQLKASDYVAQGTPVINVRNVGFGDIRRENLEYLDERMVYKLSAHLLAKDDIVFGRKGAVERHAFVRSVGEGWIQGSDCLRLRINSKRINNRFVSYYFRTQSHQDWMQAVCSLGATMATLNQTIVKLITLPLPSKEVQNNIVGVLSAYDELIENNKRRISLLEKMVEEIYREWFVRFRFPGYQSAEFDKGVPKEWDKVPFSYICKFEKGKNPDEVFDDIKDDAEIYINMESITSKGLSYAVAQSNSVHCSLGDTVMLMDGSRSGLVFRSNNNGIVDSTMSVIRTDDSIKNYVYEYLKAMNEAIIFNNTGSAIPHANKDFINRMIVYIPSDKSIIPQFNKHYDSYYSMIETIRLQVTQLETTKNMLLPRLISGKLSVENIDIQFPPSMLEEKAA